VDWVDVDIVKTIILIKGWTGGTPYMTMLII